MVCRFGKRLAFDKDNDDAGVVEERERAIHASGEGMCTGGRLDIGSIDRISSEEDCCSKRPSHSYTR